MSPSGRELPRAVQHVEVRYLGDDSHSIKNMTCRSAEEMLESGQERALEMNV